LRLHLLIFIATNNAILQTRIIIIRNAILILQIRIIIIYLGLGLGPWLMLVPVLVLLLPLLRLGET
jgi:hypothetical protein